MAGIWRVVYLLAIFTSRIDRCLKPYVRSPFGVVELVEIGG